MQNETRRLEATKDATSRRSSLERLEPALLEAVHAAIARGATIDAITALIREKGGTCSRSAVGRYVRRVRDLKRSRP